MHDDKKQRAVKAQGQTTSRQAYSSYIHDIISQNKQKTQND